MAYNGSIKQLKCNMNDEYALVEEATDIRGFFIVYYDKQSKPYVFHSSQPMRSIYHNRISDKNPIQYKSITDIQLLAMYNNLERSICEPCQKKHNEFISKPTLPQKSKEYQTRNDMQQRESCTNANYLKLSSNGQLNVIEQKIKIDDWKGPISIQDSNVANMKIGEFLSADGLILTKLRADLNDQFVYHSDQLLQFMKYRIKKQEFYYQQINLEQLLGFYQSLLDNQDKAYKLSQISDDLMKVQLLSAIKITNKEEIPTKQSEIRIIRGPETQKQPLDQTNQSNNSIHQLGNQEYPHNQVQSQFQILSGSIKPTDNNRQLKSSFQIVGQKSILLEASQSKSVIIKWDPTVFYVVDLLKSSQNLVDNHVSQLIQVSQMERTQFRLMTLTSDKQVIQSQIIESVLIICFYCHQSSYEVFITSCNHYYDVKCLLKLLEDQYKKKTKFYSCLCNQKIFLKQGIFDDTTTNLLRNQIAQNQLTYIRNANTGNIIKCPNALCDYFCWKNNKDTNRFVCQICI